MVGFLESFKLIWETCWEEWNLRGPTVNFLTEFLVEIKQNLYLETTDFILICVIAVILTFARQSLTRIILQPMADVFNFNAKDKHIFPECSFKFLIYLALFTAECSMIFFNYPEFINKPESCWTGWEAGMSIPRDIYWIYIAETGFYFHGIYSAVFLDIWRDDSLLLIIHHVLTISLIVFSLALRYHRIGLVVLILHDIADVFLESTKICKCFSSSNTNKKSFFNVMVSVGFSLFALSWIVCRLIEYPMLVLYSTGHVARSVLPDAPFYFFFNGLLWLLFGMNIWWCYFIILLIYRIISGKSKHVEDTRELNINDKHLETRNELKSSKFSERHNAFSKDNFIEDNVNGSEFGKRSTGDSHIKNNFQSKMTSRSGDECEQKQACTVESEDRLKKSRVIESSQRKRS